VKIIFFVAGWPVTVPLKLMHENWSWWVRAVVYFACMVGVIIAGIALWSVAGDHFWYHQDTWVIHPWHLSLSAISYALGGIMISLFALVYYVVQEVRDEHDPY
jgi:hypothetical protein